MIIKVLGCSGAEFPGHNPSSFLLDDRILFDAGSLTNILNENKQLKVEHIFITHAHLDHVTGIPFLAENIAFKNIRQRVQVIGIPPVIRVIKKNLLNGLIWPDFTAIPSSYDGILKLVELKVKHSIGIRDYTITPYTVNHSVQAAGYLVEDKKGKRFFYTGDTGPSDMTWKEIEGRQIHCLIIEVSFPNRMEEFAIRTGHLTPLLIKKEFEKIKPRPERIYVSHMKPQFFKTIRGEIERLGIPKLKLIEEGEIIKV